MRIVFGWNRIKLKSFSLQELNIETNEQTQNARIQVSQAYFHLFWIPFFPLGKRYSLMIGKEHYHIPAGMWQTVDKKQIRARGKWYAWTLPILAVTIGVGAIINDYYTTKGYEESFAQDLENRRSFFDDPKRGDGMIFHFPRGNSFQGEVLEVSGNKVKMLVEQLYLQDRDLKLRVMTPEERDTMNARFVRRDGLESTSRFNDSLRRVYPDQPLMRKVKIYELEGFPVRTELIEMTLSEYQKLRSSIGEYDLRPVKIPAFRKKITPHGLQVEPITGA